VPRINLCNDYDCPLKDKCQRYTLMPSGFFQAWGSFYYDEEDGCGYFWKNIEKEEDKIKVVNN